MTCSWYLFWLYETKRLGPKLFRMVQRLITCNKTQGPTGLEAIKYKLSSHKIGDKYASCLEI